jgi:hypothetical protein
MDVDLLNETLAVTPPFGEPCRKRTLLLVYSSFTPLPLSVCLMVLYSPSSSSLRS